MALLRASLSPPNLRSHMQPSLTALTSLPLPHWRWSSLDPTRSAYHPCCSKPNSLPPDERNRSGGEFILKGRHLADLNECGIRARVRKWVEGGC